jgi:hypothetical protein
MSLIGTKLSAILPANSVVIDTQVIVMKDESGNPTGRTLVDEFLDSDSDAVADLVRHQWKNDAGEVVNTWYSTPPNESGRFVSFGDRNGDDVIDDHSCTVVEVSSSTGKPMVTETRMYLDQNLDGVVDYFSRVSTHGETEWILEDLDFDGAFDRETRVTDRPSEQNPDGTRTTRDIHIDVATL